ncbi:hypothetical protein H4217_002494 [Coemansia sp. RSA 1939]|nr:hypothetical protein H4217_002494 [Coemansia sp. RSA 1939]
MPAMQVKAIGQFPKLLDQFPFPTLVSSAFLKLGDMFRSSPNSMRYHIAQVFESSQHHLVQVTHTEELLKRVISVLYSNDPIARVLALRLIGNASVVFARYPEAQHGVFLRYQSTHPLEIAATVQTTELMLKYSPELLNIVWETIISKANDSKVPDPVRAQLIRSLQHAASNLQLGVRLYSNCRSWVSNTESTTIIRLAALYTWKVIIQPHNELRLEDAAIVAGYISYSTDAVSKASLALLSKWRYDEQTTTNSLDSVAISIVKQKLNDYFRAQLDYPAATADLRSIRLAMVTLSRLESATEQSGISKCWGLAESICACYLRVLRGEIPNMTSILDSMEKDTVDIDVRDSKYSELDVSIDRAKLLLQQAQGPFHKAKPIVHDVAESRAFHAFVRSVMTAVNVASVSNVVAPDLESSSPIVVYSGSQFHFTVEGFIRHSIERISMTFQRINVSIWISRHPFSEDSLYDLQSCTHFNTIAWNKHCGIQKRCDLLSAAENDDASWSKIWNSANVFTANIESTYFACPCTVAMPSLHSLFGHVDTDMAVHIHVACALADASGNVYYVGPHKSYPLSVSTTVKP